MSYLAHLKRYKMNHQSRWIVKYDSSDLVKEVKLVYCPEEYRKNKKAKPLNTQNGLIKILEHDRRKRNT